MFGLGISTKELMKQLNESLYEDPGTYLLAHLQLDRYLFSIIIASVMALITLTILLIRKYCRTFNEFVPEAWQVHGIYDKLSTIYSLVFFYIIVCWCSFAWELGWPPFRSWTRMNTF